MSSMSLIKITWSAMTFLAPLHILFYSVLLGTELYLSFVMLKVCHQSLPRAAFTTLLERIFPIYFRDQVLLILLTAVTIPPYGLLTLLESKANWIPFFIAGVTALLNMVVYGPRTRRMMIDRIRQETRDEEKSNNPIEPDGDMKALTRSFSHNHAMSIHLNLVSIGAMVWWAWKLASRLEC
ncbi:uncharacterized protein F4807DRAFT_428038 [Annulohypoxylon truncatum]|uniref:uncharacterized protein n=1 Tax=Annulohypoxylon truncatum TaxID=327061 RepID=UPI002008D74F|nr:uncharacterized protein F4807DRAFT_428038 [Annulohypoxylon truncatum]KAI1209334.1 hypothetical protein F4807DRAFT_428038 [Annulohypoxylon truncatum]